MKVQDRLDKNRIGDLVCDGAYKYVQNFAVEIDGKRVAEYDNLDTVTKEWEDYEGPKEYWYIDTLSNEVVLNTTLIIEDIENDKQIGNYFETEEEAERAVEKLKAYKRLKDKGFRFDGWDENHHNLGIIEFSFCNIEKSVYDFSKDLDLLFGEEE